MAEYRRNGTHHFTGVELFMVIDSFTGEPQRFGKHGYRESIGTLNDALDHVEGMLGWADSLVIVKVDCIKAFKIGA